MISKLAITVICLGASFAAVAQTTAASGWTLLGEAQIKGPGIFLNQVVAETTLVPEGVQLAPSPAPGRAVEWSKKQVVELARKAGISSVVTQWSGADRIRISRPGRMLAEGELKDLLTATMQNEIVRDKGELELRFSRPWTAAMIPDEPIRVRVVDVPVAGVTPNFIARFELRTDHELLGTWQAALQARVWRDVWVARSAQPRGRLVKDADLVQERRDVLMMRDALASLEVPEGSLELAESLSVGSPVLTRSVRLRPVVCRGKAIEALLKDGALLISVRVEALEDGLPGQTIRVRNQKTRRELQAKVQDEQTVIINM